jgi:hypothetical protein
MSSIRPRARPGLIQRRQPEMAVLLCSCRASLPHRPSRYLSRRLTLLRLCSRVPHTLSLRNSLRLEHPRNHRLPRYSISNNRPSRQRIPTPRIRPCLRPRIHNRTIRVGRLARPQHSRLVVCFITLTTLPSIQSLVSLLKICSGETAHPYLW